jgi:hypothetical protein
MVKIYSGVSITEMRSDKQHKNKNHSVYLSSLQNNLNILQVRLRGAENKILVRKKEASKKDSFTIKQIVTL